MQEKKLECRDEIMREDEGRMRNAGAPGRLNTMGCDGELFALSRRRLFPWPPIFVRVNIGKRDGHEVVEAGIDGKH